MKVFSRLLLLFVLLLASGNCLHAQNNSGPDFADLRKEIADTKADTTRIRLLLKMARLYVGTWEVLPFYDGDDKLPYQFDSGFSLIHRAIQLSEKLGSEQLHLQSLDHLGVYYFKKKENQSGKACFLKVISHLDSIGKLQEEVRWLSKLSQYIPATDTASFTKLDCLNRLLTVRKKINNEEGIMATELDIADYYLGREYWNIAEKEIQSVLAKHKGLRGHSFNSANFLLSVINRYNGNLDQSLHYSLICVQNANKKNDEVSLPYYYGELAMVYDDLGIYEKAAEWYEKTMELRKSGVYRFTYYNTAAFLIRLQVKYHHLAEAWDILNKLETETAPRTSFDKFILTQIKANYYFGAKDLKMAAKYFHQLSTINFDLIMTALVSIAYQEMGVYYRTTRQFALAKKWLFKAMENPDEVPSTRKKDIEHELFLVDSSNGEFVSAIRHLRRYQYLKESIFNEKKSQLIEELQVQSENSKKEHAIQLLEKEKMVHQVSLAQEKNTRNWTIAVLLLLVVIVSILSGSYIRKRKTSRTLAVQQCEIEQQNASLQYAIMEKDWLVKEIHHRVKNNLHSISGLLDSQYGLLKDDHAQLSYRTIQQRVQVISLMHQKLFQRKDLASIDMTSYIHELSEYFTHSFEPSQNLRIRLDVDPMVAGTSHALSIGLLLNEAVSNSIKHGFPAGVAGEILIQLKEISPCRFLLKIIDNGKGLPPDIDFRQSNSMGINMMIKLVADIDGEISVTTHKGTAVSILYSYDHHIPFILPANQFASAV